MRNLSGWGWTWVRTQDGRSGALRYMRYNDATDMPEAFIEWENQAGAGDWIPIEDEDGNCLISLAALSEARVEGGGE